MSDKISRVWGEILTLAALIALSLVASGCRPSITPSPAPTPRVITVQATTTLFSLQPLFTACTTAQKTTALILTESPTSSINTDQVNLAIRWGMDSPPDGFAAVLGYEDMVVIVHPQNSLQQISLADLLAIYTGSLNTWPESSPGGAIQPWSYPDSEDIQVLFTQAIRKGLPPARSSTSLAPDPRAMLEAVAANPSAIGFLPKRWLTNQVKEIPVQGLDRSSLRFPILALTNSEPTGEIKDWLLCVQAGLVE